ncbi:hypothetical protein F5Y10DRAFT_271776 [Nemania abortiva]|nr:hypothetical protein F5Y10DRAFT_271776 [Nemania abortiva]
MEVEALIPQLQNTLSEISSTVHGLSTKSQDDELDQLERKRERLLGDLQASFEREKQELETKHRKELEEIKKKRKQEDEERAARRRREDEELKKASSKDDKQWQHRRDSAVEIIEDETGQQMDQVEEEAQRMVEEGKKRLQDLEEKRRDLNRRIDEQLKQSLPTAPSRKKDRQKKEKSNVPKDGTNGDSVSNALPKNESTPKDSNKPDTPSKHQEPGDSPAKSPESKKDGELPFQDASRGLPQAAIRPIGKLPKTFAEALKSNMSNESKGKAKLGKGSSDPMRKESSDHAERPSDVLLHEVKTIPKREEDITRQHKTIENMELPFSGKAEPAGAGNQRNEELPHDNPTTFKPISPKNNKSAESKQVNQTKSTQNPTSFETTSTGTHDPTVSKVGEVKQESQIERPSEQRRLTVIDNLELDPLSESTTVHEFCAVPEDAPRKSHSPVHVSDDEVHTVGPKSTYQPPSPSYPPEERTSGQVIETDNYMEPRQPTAADSLEQGYSGDGRDTFSALGQSQPCSRSSKTPVKPVPSTPPSSIQGDFPLLEPATHIGFDELRNTTTEYISTIGQQAWRGPTSPLPVENETVRGQDRLFDDHKSVSDHSERHSGDEESDFSPQTPIEGQDLPVLLDTSLNHRLYEPGLVTLVDEPGSWAIVTEQGDKDHSQLASNLTPVQEARNFGRQDVKTKLCEAGDCEVNCTDGRGSNCPQPAPAKLFNHVLSGQGDPASEEQNISLRCTPPAGPKHSKHKRRNSSVETPRKRPKRRGRQISRSPQSPERALNPREQLFQGSDDDIDIRSAWFKRSKRGSS